MINKIEKVEDVKAFAKHLTVIEKISFHPDDDFSDYVNTETQEPTYSQEEAELRNDLMNQCFKICEQNNVDIYDIMGEIYLIESGMDKYIPLPSQPYAE